MVKCEPHKTEKLQWMNQPQIQSVIDFFQAFSEIAEGLMNIFLRLRKTYFVKELWRTTMIRIIIINFMETRPVLHEATELKKYKLQVLKRNISTASL